MNNKQKKNAKEEENKMEKKKIRKLG